MKKLTALLLSVTMLLTMCLSVSAESFTSHNVTVSVNGKQYQTVAYPMSGSENGIKLRDIAAMLNGTNVQFNVTWQAPNTVNIEKGSSYAANGTELQLGEGSVKEGAYSEHQFLVDGEYSGIEGNNIAGNNYLPLESFLYNTFGIIPQPDENGVIVINTEGIQGGGIDEH